MTALESTFSTGLCRLTVFTGVTSQARQPLGRSSSKPTNSPKHRQTLPEILPHFRDLEVWDCRRKTELLVLKSIFRRNMGSPGTRTCPNQPLFPGKAKHTVARKGKAGAGEHKGRREMIGTSIIEARQRKRSFE